jgi:hybrid cluster-associated redox disulfide protein
VTRAPHAESLRLAVTVEYQHVTRAAPAKETEIFTRDMSMMEALQADPRARDVFAAFGMGCIGCMGASMESIEEGARMHGIDPDAVLADLNKLATEKEAET